MNYADYPAWKSVSRGERIRTTVAIVLGPRNVEALDEYLDFIRENTTPNASGRLLIEHAAALAKVLGNSIHGDASAKRRLPLIAISLSDRDGCAARKREGKTGECRCSTATPEPGRPSLVAIPAGCGGECRDDLRVVVAECLGVAIPAGCGGECRSRPPFSTSKPRRVAIPAGCGGERRSCTSSRIENGPLVAIPAGCGGECRHGLEALRGVGRDRDQLGVP